MGVVKDGDTFRSNRDPTNPMLMLDRRIVELLYETHVQCVRSTSLYPHVKRRCSRTLFI